MPEGQHFSVLRQLSEETSAVSMPEYCLAGRGTVGFRGPLRGASAVGDTASSEWQGCLGSWPMTSRATSGKRVGHGLPGLAQLAAPSPLSALGRLAPPGLALGKGLGHCTAQPSPLRALVVLSPYILGNPVQGLSEQPGDSTSCPVRSEGC